MTWPQSKTIDTRFSSLDLLFVLYGYTSAFCLSLF